MRISYLCAVCALLAIACTPNIEIAGQLDKEADIFPDYKNVTVPVNIAPLNFCYNGEGECALIVDGECISPRRGSSFEFGPRQWRKWMSRDSLTMTLALKEDEVWKACKSFCIYISKDEIDPYISYRLIPPGYQGWQYMGIFQRKLSTFEERAIISNDMSGGNCLNCHTYCKGNTDKMLFHARAEFGGTLMLKEGKVQKLDTKTDSTISALVYPYWHPDGRYVAFSVNKTLQSFFAHNPDRIEVFDSESDVVVLDTDNMSLLLTPRLRTAERCETFPCFSPDGKWLYFCACDTPEQMPRDYDKSKYSIYRIAFDSQNAVFGEETELVFDAASMDKSASFPRISPDGKYLVFTLHSYGNFSIWHKDADLWMLNLDDGSVKELSELNTDEVESWHCWSSSGRWMIFSSRRDDGLYTRSYIAYIDQLGNAHKAFLLPQKDPKDYYKSMLNSYNLPEFMTGPVRASKRSITDAMRSTQCVKVK